MQDLAGFVAEVVPVDGILRAQQDPGGRDQGARSGQGGERLEAAEALQVQSVDGLVDGLAPAGRVALLRRGAQVPEHVIDHALPQRDVGFPWVDLDLEAGHALRRQGQPAHGAEDALEAPLCDHPAGLVPALGVQHQLVIAGEVSFLDDPDEQAQHQALLDVVEGQALVVAVASPHADHATMLEAPTSQPLDHRSPLDAGLFVQRALATVGLGQQISVPLGVVGAQGALAEQPALEQHSIVGVRPADRGFVHVEVVALGFGHDVPLDLPDYRDWR